MKRFAVLTGMFGLLAAMTVGPSAAEGQVFRSRSQFQPVPQVAPQLMQATPVAAGEFGASKKLGPVTCVAVRMHLQKEYRKQGMGLVEAIAKSREATDTVINGLMVDAEKIAQAKVAGASFGAIGDGTIINAIIDFFKSPQGQQLIAALIQLLLHALGADSGINPIHPEGVTFAVGIPPPHASLFC